MLVAGARASTQTLPIPSGKRVIFCNLEGGSGLVDIAFFEDSHEHVAHTGFRSGLLLVRGTVEARGPRRTVVGEMAWDLDEVAAARRDHGPQAARGLLGLLGRTGPAPTPAQPATPQRTLADGTTGARLHPYADLQPARTRSADLRRLSHRNREAQGDHDERPPYPSPLLRRAARRRNRTPGTPAPLAGGLHAARSDA